MYLGLIKPFNTNYVNPQLCCGLIQPDNFILIRYWTSDLSGVFEFLCCQFLHEHSIYIYN